MIRVSAASRQSAAHRLNRWAVDAAADLTETNTYTVRPVLQGQ